MSISNIMWKGKGVFLHGLVTDNSLNLSEREKHKLKEACKEFEAIFVGYMLKKMREAIPKSKFIYGGLGEDIFQDLADEELAKETVRSQGLGLAELLYAEFLPSYRTKVYLNERLVRRKRFYPLER